jgi:hypothetical protein
LSTTAVANAQARLRLLVQDDLPAGAAERIEGQIADLPWSMEPAAGAIATHEAEAIAEARGARAVLWITEDANGFALSLFDAGRRRWLERRFPRARGGGNEALGRSAALESLALAVRSALRAMSEEPAAAHATSGGGTPAVNATGGEGRAATATATENTTNAQPRTSGSDSGSDSDSDADSDSASDSDSDAEESPGITFTHDDPSVRSGATHPALIAAVAWTAALDGQSPVQHGPAARLGIAWDRLEVAAEGELTLPAELNDGQTRIALQRSVALATVSFEVAASQRLSLAAAGGIGVAWFARDTRSVAAGLEATEASTLQAFATELELRGRLRLVGGTGAALDLELCAGALVLPAAPVLRYERSGGGRVEHPLWRLAPHLRLGPYLRVPL